MAIRRVTIVNCKSASIRRKPWDPWHENDITGIRNGPKESNDSVKMGSSIEIDTDEISYSWSGRKFYKVVRPKGWIYEGCIDYEEESVDGQ